MPVKSTGGPFGGLDSKDGVRRIQTIKKTQVTGRFHVCGLPLILPILILIFKLTTPPACAKAGRQFRYWQAITTSGNLQREVIGSEQEEEKELSSFAQERLGVVVQPVTPQLAEKYGLERPDKA